MKDKNDGLDKLLEFYEGFVEKTSQGHSEARRRRDYVNNKQWTDEEEDKIRSRGQPIVTDNAIKRKTDYFLGIERQTRTDPKAYPRTPNHEEEGEAFTDALRYVCDNNEWDIERSEGFDTLITEGIEGFAVTVETVPSAKGQDNEIKINQIPWDRLIYDPHSRDRFFRDAKYKGVVLWMDESDAKDMFPGSEEALSDSYMRSDSDDVFDDKPNKAVWSDKSRKRIKVVQLYHLKQGVWMHSIFTKGGFLQETEESQFHDEFGRPDCPLEFGGAYIDKDNDRFGLVEDMISMSDMNNKLLSKMTHILNSTQTWGNQRGPDAKEAKKAGNNPNGHYSLDGDGKFGQDFGVIPTDNKAQHASNLLNYVQNSLDSIGGNSMVGGSESGRSKEIDQQTKNLELGPVLDTHRQICKRVYKQAWNRIKQYKTDEWWVRVTDDEDVLRYVSLNKPMTYRDALEEKYGKVPPEAEGNPQLEQPVLDENGQPKQIRNNVAELDVDIILEDAPDTVNLQQEQFQVIAKLAETYGPEHVPFEEVLKLSSLRNKKQFNDRTKGSEEDQAAAQQQAQQKAQQAEQMQMQMAQAEMQSKSAKAQLDGANAQKAMAEAQTMGVTAQNAQAEMGLRNQELINAKYKIDTDAQVEIQKVNINAQADIQRAQITQQSDVTEAQIAAQAKRDVAAIQANADLMAKEAERCAMEMTVVDKPDMEMEEKDEKQPIVIHNHIPSGNKSVSIQRNEQGISGAEVREV